MLNNLSLAFKTYLTVVNNCMQKHKQFEEDEILFKAIEEEETRIKAKHKACANFATTNFDAKTQELTKNRKKEFVEWPKFRKYGCKYLADQAYKHANKEFDNYYKKKTISYFYNNYTSLNKRRILQRPGITSSIDFRKNMSCVTQIRVNKMFVTSITQKIIADLVTTQHFIANCKLFNNYYNDYLKYQSRSEEILPFYKKDIFLLSLDNIFLKLSNI